MISRAHRLFGLIFISLLATVASQAAMGPVSGEQALRDISRLTKLRPDMSVYHAQGDSMEPFFYADDLLLVTETSWDNLEKGQIAVFRDSEGDIVAHQVTKVRGDEAKTEGYNNRRSDREPLRPEAFIGVVAGVMHTAGFADDSGLPVALGKSDRK